MKKAISLLIVATLAIGMLSISAFADVVEDPSEEARYDALYSTPVEQKYIVAGAGEEINVYYDPADTDVVYTVPNGTELNVYHIYDEIWLNSEQGWILSEDVILLDENGEPTAEQSVSQQRGTDANPPSTGPNLLLIVSALVLVVVMLTMAVVLKKKKKS